MGIQSCQFCVFLKNSTELSEFTEIVNENRKNSNKSKLVVTCRIPEIYSLEVLRKAYDLQISSVKYVK